MQKINESYMYISIESFQQNKLIAKQLRKDVSRLITNQSVCSIGGESCIIALSSPVCKAGFKFPHLPPEIVDTTFLDRLETLFHGRDGG